VYLLSITARANGRLGEQIAFTSNTQPDTGGCSAFGAEVGYWVLGAYKTNTQHPTSSTLLDNALNTEQNDHLED
jgi:hypothetical protein